MVWMNFFQELYSAVVTVQIQLQPSSRDVVMLSAEILQAVASIGIDKCYEHVSFQFSLHCSQ